MKYHEISNSGSELKLDYKTPKWFIPAIILVIATFLVLGVIGTKIGDNVIIIWIVSIGGIGFSLYSLSSYTKKRPITINYINKTLEIDGEVIPFEDIQNVEVMNNATFILKDYEDKNYPQKFVSGKQSLTTYYTVVVTKSKVFKVSLGWKHSAIKQADRFRKYLKLT